MSQALEPLNPRPLTLRRRMTRNLPSMGRLSSLTISERGVMTVTVDTATDTIVALVAMLKHTDTVLTKAPDRWMSNPVGRRRSPSDRPAARVVRLLCDRDRLDGAGPGNRERPCWA
jgi:hypothetical protein